MNERFEACKQGGECRFKCEWWNVLHALALVHGSPYTKFFHCSQAHRTLLAPELAEQAQQAVSQLEDQSAIPGDIQAEAVEVLTKVLEQQDTVDTFLDWLERKKVRKAGYFQLESLCTECMWMQILY